MGETSESEAYTSRFLESFYSDNLIEAYRLLVQAESVLGKESLRLLNEKPEAEVVRLNVASADKCLQMLSDYDSWTLLRDENSIQTWSQEANGDFFVRAEMTVHKSVFPVLALFSEVDLLKQLIQELELAEVVFEPSLFRKVIRYKYNLPWPITSRELILECFGLPVVEAKSILIAFRTPKVENYLGFDIPAAGPDVVRIDIPFGCVNLMYVSEEETLVTLIVRSNLKVSVLPVKLINYGTKQIVFTMMEKIQAFLRTYEGSEYEYRVKAKGNYYGEINRRMHECHLDSS